MAAGPVDTICATLNPVTLSHSLCGEIFWNQSSKEYQAAIREVSSVDPETLWKQMCQTNASLMKQAETFFIFQARLSSSSKKKPVSWVLIINHQVTIYNDQTRHLECNHLTISSVARKDDFQLVLTFEDNTTMKLILEGDNKKIYDLLVRYLDPAQVKLNNFRVFLECLTTWKGPAPLDFMKLNGAILALFTQPDFFVLRTVVSMRMESQVKRTIGTSLVRIFAYQHWLSFYIAYVSWLYFLNPPPPEGLLRGDTILTTSLAGVRDIYGRQYLEDLLQDMERRVATVSGTDEVSNAFMEALETREMPKVIKWVCWCIFKEARKAFPEGNGAYNAVSGFFFLRGLFPMIAVMENSDTKKKLMGMSSLTNLVSKPETEKFLPRMRKFIEDVTVMDITAKDIESNVPIEVVKESIGNLFAAFAEHADGMLGQLPTVVITGIHPMKWFVMEQVQISKSTSPSA